MSNVEFNFEKLSDTTFFAIAKHGIKNCMKAYYSNEYLGMGPAGIKLDIDPGVMEYWKAVNFAIKAGREFAKINELTKAQVLTLATEN